MQKDDLKRQMMAAMKKHATVEKEILRVVLGEVDVAESRGGKPLSEEELLGVVRKLLKSNEETLAISEREEQRRVLEEENAILQALLPARWEVARIASELAAFAAELRAAPNDGAATGLAMKRLKAAAAPVDGKDVALAVRQLRS
ncbi:MAG: GatB/YqeY domain-containing protein [Sorangiineae bacterium]|nr:GatB/YqeY domain-containing protein [Polyangiaceae bacterium]MEB2323243.1 GatB/YqeY domain-containing protein [Sorangiineae bacterium]